MPNFENILPPTVIAAATIFALREILEIIRKSRARSRKIKAYKSILAEELERNFWTWKSLRSSVKWLQEYRDVDIGVTHKVVATPGGAQYLESRYDDGSLSSSTKLPNAYRGAFERVLLGLAEESEKLYALASTAYDEISDLAHIRSGLIDQLGSENDAHLDGFLDYAAKSLDSAIGPIKDLYRECTGKELEQYKLR
jgi:hypothetical protein